MDTSFHYDPTAYHEQVIQIAEHVVANDDALLTMARRIEVDSNSYHAPAIARAEEDRLDRLYPRLRR